MPAAARLGDKAQVQADAHGCPACPHPGVGPVTVGSPDVKINGKPAARLDDIGIHAACCGPNNFTIVKGSGTVYVNGKPLARMGDKTKHCGGTGPLTEGSPNVLADDGAAAAAALAAKKFAEHKIKTAKSKEHKKGDGKHAKGDTHHGTGKEVPSHDAHGGAHGKDAHAKDAHAKDAHHKDAHAKDAHHKDAHAKDPHHKDAHAKDPHHKDAHAKDPHHKDAHAKDPHHKDAHAKDPHHKDAHDPKHKPAPKQQPKKDQPPAKDQQDPADDPQQDPRFSNLDWGDAPDELNQGDTVELTADADAELNGRRVRFVIETKRDGEWQAQQQAGTTVQSGAASVHVTLAHPGERDGDDEPVEVRFYVETVD